MGNSLFLCHPRGKSHSDTTTCGTDDGSVILLEDTSGYKCTCWHRGFNHDALSNPQVCHGTECAGFNFQNILRYPRHFTELLQNLFGTKTCILLGLRTQPPPAVWHTCIFKISYCTLLMIMYWNATVLCKMWDSGHCTMWASSRLASAA